jgi:hypothetical protein
MANLTFTFKAGHYCTTDGAMGSNLFIFTNKLLGLAWINLRKGESRERLPGELEVS